MYQTSRYEHDEALRIYALQLLFDGYDVKARIEGWFQYPDYVYGYRPDIVARKGDQWILVEIKKSDTDWPKISALERFGREQGNYQLRVVSPNEVLAKRLA